MSPLLSIVRREVQAYFVSPIAYTVIVGFLIISGFGFASSLSDYAAIPPRALAEQEVTLQSVLVTQIATWMSMAIVLCLPALSMRLFSEDRKAGTIELLMTSPVSTLQLVLGKYLGAMTVYIVILLLTLPYLLVLGLRATPEWGAMAMAYLGILLFGALLLALGVFASAITENQIVALVTTYALFIPFFLVDIVVRFVGTGLGDVLAGLSVSVGLFSMARGLLDTHDLVLHGALSFLFLFLSGQALDSSRWR